MAQESHLSRYRLVLLSFTAIAAGCGVYALLSAYNRRSSASSSLQRRNAVHRPRRGRHLYSTDYVSPTPNLPLGLLIVSLDHRNPDALEPVLNLIQFRFDWPDDRRDFRHFVSRLGEETRQELEDAALDLVLLSCFTATGSPQILERIEELGLGPLSSAMSARGEDLIRRTMHDLRDSISVGHHITDDQLFRAAKRFLESDRWVGSSYTASEEASYPAPTEEMDATANRDPSQRLRALLYFISEENSKRKAYEHRGINCQVCGEFPIRGVRWHCLNCADYDLCSTCEMQNTHFKTHVFAKIKIPLPVLSQPTKEYILWYPGDPKTMNDPLDASLKQRLCLEHQLESEQLDALYDQFTCLANVPWPVERSGARAAIDRQAFNKSLSSERWPKRLTANVMYDRMFSFYDTDNNGLIDFLEFVSGMAYLRGPRRYASLERTIRGYDLDYDGFVDRQDFIRLLSAKFEIQRQLVNDMIEGQDIEHSPGGVDILKSGQPISSIFAQEEIPGGQTIYLRGKRPNSLGDLEPVEGAQTILKDNDPWPRHASLRRRSAERLPLSEWIRHDEERIRGETTTMARSSGYNEFGMHMADQDECPFGGCGGTHHFRPPSPVSLRCDHKSVPHNQDLLWEITQKSLRELLDGMFNRKELLDGEAIATRDERMQWRKEIDAVVAAKRKLRQEADEAASSDPLLATAMDSRDHIHGARKENHNPNHSVVPPSDSKTVLFFWDILRRLHTEYGRNIESLIAPGSSWMYSAEGAGPRVADTSGSSTIWCGGPSTQRTEASSPLATRVVISNQVAEQSDSTFLQDSAGEDRDLDPDPSGSDTAKNNQSESGKSPRDPPPHEIRLRFLAIMDDLDRWIQERGGPGRLSYTEVEYYLVELNSDPHLRGTIKSWLEWASF